MRFRPIDRRKRIRRRKNRHGKRSFIGGLRK
jgi:hypothetical protein